MKGDMRIFQNIIFAFALAIVVVFLVRVFLGLLPMVAGMVQMARTGEEIDQSFFLQSMNDNTKKTILTNKYNAASFMAMDDKRFTIVLENTEKQQTKRMILEPFYYKEFYDYRKVSSHIIIADDVILFRYGAFFFYEPGEGLIDEFNRALDN